MIELIKLIESVQIQN